MRDIASVSHQGSKINHILASPAAYTTTLITLLTFSFLGLTLTPDLNSASATSTTLNLSATVEPVLSMSVATYNPSTSTYDPTIKNIVMEIEHGTTSTLTSRILASTNNATGYTLSFKDTDNITDLAPVTSTTTTSGVTTYTYNTTGAVISPVSPNTPLSSFNDNTWGYAVQTTSTSAPEPSTPTTYNPVSTTSTPIYDTSTPSSNYHYFTVATKVGDTLPADTYQDQVIFSLIANSLPYMPDFFHTEYMQDFTTTICNSVATPLASTTEVTVDNGADYYVINSHPTKVPSTKIKDKRDNQEYTIRKLADGNCWMTENLRLGKEGAITLDSTNSNMTAGRTFDLPKAKTIEEYNAKVAQDGKGWTWGNQEAYPFTFYRNDGEPGTGAPLNTVLYNWYTATAGARNSADSSLMTTASGRAADSVCPKNWQLPINSSSMDDGIKSYGHLVGVYTGNSGNRHGNISGQTTATVQADLAKLHADPTSFAYSDYYYYGGTLDSSSIGRWWSSTVNSATHSYYLNLDNYNSPYYISPQGSYSKGYAFAVRCVLSAPAA